MKKVLVAVLVLCGLVPAVQAVDVFGTEIGVTADITFMSRYMWRGYDVMGSSPVWHPSLDFDLGGGFGANIWAAYPHNAGWAERGAQEGSRVDKTEFNYTLYYKGAILDDCWKTDYKVGWRYYDFIDTSSKNADAQELFVEMAMPQLVGQGLVPRMAYYYMWQSESGGDNDGDNRFGSACFFVPGFDYNFTLPDMPDFPMTFSWDITYATSGERDADDEWTHMTWGLKTEIACPVIAGAKLTPMVYFQNTFDKGLNDDRRPGSDYLYGGVSYSLKF